MEGCEKYPLSPLLIYTGLISIGPLTKKLLQKYRPVSYSKNTKKTCTFPMAPY